jgi:hypothetical protein
MAEKRLFDKTPVVNREGAVIGGGYGYGIE